jgi:hypothetical protein
MSTESSKALNVSSQSVKEKPKAQVEAEPAARTLLAAPVALPLPSWVRRVAAVVAIVIGWAFIAWHNHFYLTPAVVILALGWAASISTLYFLWRVGAAGGDAAATREDWWLAIGQQEELEREKRALLKTIREIEFDQQTGKLSPHDAQEMIQVVRVRAIEVMKALDAVEQGGGARAEIEREVRARLEIEKARKAGAAAKKSKAGDKAKDAKPSDVKPAAKNETKSESKSDAKSESKSDAKSESKGDAKVESARSATAINAAAAADEPARLEAAADHADHADHADDEPKDRAAAGDDSDDGDDGADDGAAGDEPGDGAAVASATSPTGPKSSEVSA